MAYWKPLIVNGALVDLAHLEPFNFSVLPTGFVEEVVVDVIFSNHCFSESFAVGVHSEALPKSHSNKNENRAFDAVRYELSKSLPKHICSLPDKHILERRDKKDGHSLVYVTLENGEEYAIFFRLKRADGKVCLLNVVSAYSTDKTRMNRTERKGRMKFNTALAFVMKNKSLKFPNL